MKKRTYLLMLVLFGYCNYLQGQIGLDINLPDNPSLQVRTDNFTAELGIATCIGCFSAVSQIGDVVLSINRKG